MKLYFTTEEAANHLDISVSKLGYYLKEFRINVKKIARVRKFSHSDIEKLSTIVHLIDTEGYTLEGAKDKLKSKKNEENVNLNVVNKLKDIRSILVMINEHLAD